MPGGRRSRSSSNVARGRGSEDRSLDRVLGVRFRDGSLRTLALTHRSHAFENDLPANNERLEFLGDAVLGVVVTDMAFREFPDMPEGELAKLRAAIVNMGALSDIARDLGIGRFVLLGKGEEMSGGRDKSSILADALEALLGAVYLDRGLDATRKLIHRVFRPRMIAYVRGEGERDYKTILQEMASAEVRAVPEYRIRERGPDHEKEFTATVFLAGKEWGSGIGRSKKEAEQQAAHEAYLRLSEQESETAEAEPPPARRADARAAAPRKRGARGAEEASADARAAAPRKEGA
ncbi:MAG TPA: ribonuclease III [Actinomycetota bacterium]|nr:ribonuclease III [Actinomycetota bacterium]